MRPNTLAIFGTALALLSITPAWAAPARYSLDPAASTVGFQTDFGPDHINGKMPVTSADLTIDFDKLTASKVSVTLDAANADASFPFATQAMRGPKVLDVEAHPQITFVSTAVRGKTPSEAQVDGNITIRGVTKPITFDAGIWRQQGNDEGDVNKLTIRLVGTVNRSDFGAVGWNDMVSDQVRLDIVARISRD